MPTLLEEKKRELERQSVVHLLTLAGFVIPVYFFAWLAMFLVVPNHQGWTALLLVLVLFAAGIVTRLRSSFDQWKSYVLPFENVSGGAWAVNRAVNRVMGPASLISDFLLAGAGQLLDFISKRKLLGALAQVNEVEMMNLIAELRARGTRPRLHPASDFARYFPQLPPLIAADILWTASDRGVTKIGLNSAYDRA